MANEGNCFIFFPSCGDMVISGLYVSMSVYLTYSDFAKGNKTQLKFDCRRKSRFIITHLPVPFLSQGVLMVILNTDVRKTELFPIFHERYLRIKRQFFKFSTSAVRDRKFANRAGAERNFAHSYYPDLNAVRSSKPLPSLPWPLGQVRLFGFVD